MGRKLSHVMLMIITGIVMCACSAFPEKSKTVGQVIRPQDTKQELNIILNVANAGFTKWEPFEKYKENFEKQYGVKVNYIKIGGSVPTKENIESFHSELAAKLHLTDGPELIYFSGDFVFDALIKQKAVIDVKNKISSISSIYDSLVGKKLYCVPVSITYRPIVLNREVLEVLGIKELELGWRKKDYYGIKDKWLDKFEAVFTYYEYNDIINKYLSGLDIFNAEEKKADINTPHMKDSIKKIRDEVFSGKYKLKSNYKHEDYYNMMYEYLSEEYKEDSDLRHSKAYKSQVPRNRSYEHNITPLKPEDTSYLISSGQAVFMPHFSDETSGIVYSGFLVNRNGKNIELACEFINGLLSKEVQMQIYENSDDSYPVNKELEEYIRDLEAQAELDERAIELKNYVLNQIKNGGCKLWTDYSGVKESELFWKLIKDLAKYIFADKPYSDEELSQELKILEDKYSIWLNE